MIPDDLTHLLAGETDRVEYKQSPGQRDQILQAVCALANDLSATGAPGFVVIGVDNTGAIVGVAGPRTLDEMQKELADRLRSQKIQPVPSTSITVHEREGQNVIVVEVEPYPVPPIVEVDSVAWVRVGTTTRRATHADLHRLNERRPTRSLPFDTRPFLGATLDDLDLTRLRASWQADRESDQHPESFPDLPAWLEQRQLGRRGDESWTPNAAALLIHGKSPQDWLPSAWIDLVRFAGRDVDAPVISRRPATGTVTDQLEVAWAWLSAQIENLPLHSQGMVESFGPAYPVEAFQELIRNLVQHRVYDSTNAPGRVEWFEDRVDISNPGGPFGRASEGRFGEHSDYRNPLLTKHLVDLGYVQQLGRGIRRVRILLANNGNPELEVTTDGFTRVVVRRRS